MTSSTHVGAIAVLPVREMEGATAFYRSLGFEVAAYDADYSWVSHLGHEILHLRHVPELDPGANRASCYLHVTDVDGFHAALPDEIATGPIIGQPWGMREFEVTDPSGNVLRFGQAG